MNIKNINIPVEVLERCLELARQHGDTEIPLSALLVETNKDYITKTLTEEIENNIFLACHCGKTPELRTLKVVKQI